MNKQQLTHGAECNMGFIFRVLLFLLFIFTSLQASENNSKNKRTRKINPILHEKTCVNWFIARRENSAYFPFSPNKLTSKSEVVALESAIMKPNSAITNEQRFRLTKQNALFALIALIFMFVWQKLCIQSKSRPHRMH